MSLNKNFAVFAGRSHLKFAEEVAKLLHTSLGNVVIKDFPDGEIGVHLGDNVRGQDVFVIQSMARQPNFYLMELLMLIDALKRSSARHICAVIPYFCYARQDRRNKGREPISARLVADLLQTAGATSVLTMDLHSDQIEGFFEKPVDHLRAFVEMIKVIKNCGVSPEVVVSPDVGGVKLGRDYAAAIGVDLAVVNKRRLNAEQVEANALIGDVKGKEVLLVDDMCSTGSTLKMAAIACKALGAKQVYAAVTHGVILEAIQDCLEIDTLFVTDTVPLKEKSSKVKVVSVAPLFAKAISSILEGTSITSLCRSY